MKLIFEIGLIATALILLFITNSARKDPRAYVRRLGLVTFVALIASIANLAMLSDSPRHVLLASSIFYSSMDYLIIFLYEYIVEYTGVCKEFFNRSRKIIFTIAGFDASLLLANNFLHLSFGYVVKTTETGETVIRVIGYPPYTFHLVICYLGVIAIFATLIYKSIVSPSFYKKKYIRPMIVFLIAVAMDGMYVFLNSYYELGVVTYALGAIIIYYYSAVFAPKELQHASMITVVKEMEDSIYIFDVDDACTYINDAGRQMMDVEPEINAGKALLGFRHRYPELRQGFLNIEQTVKVLGVPKVLEMTYQSIVDKKGRYAGCFVRIQDRTEEVEKAREERYRATHDSLTQVYNFPKFLDRCKEVLSENPDVPYYMICSDIDNFKLINDVFGMTTGDRILRQIAEAISERVMDYDTYGRIGDDKFAIMMPKEKFREDYFIRETDMKVDIDELEDLPLNIYLGVYEIMDTSDAVSVMCDRAIMAIKSIKGSMATRIAYYDDKMRRALLEEREIISDLDAGIANHEFVLFLQPQFNNAGQVYGGEALVRWQHPTKGLLFPGSFIEIYEKKGLITKLDEYVWESACQKLAEWKNKGYTDKYISVNISARDMYVLNIYDIFTGLVEKYEIEARNLHLEITETAVIMNVEQQTDLINKLRDFGFEVEMDDFGSGYSSLNMLKNIDIDVLKIDMAFLGRGENLEKSNRILENILRMATDLKLETIIEGVETKEELEFLKSIGGEKYQGYYFEKPIPMEAFEEKYITI